MMNSPRGRRRGPSDTRQRLLDAGRELFLAYGYDATSLRTIGERAGVDPAMVNYWFGGKEGLLRAVLELTVMPGQIVDRVIARHPDDLATALLRTAVGLWDHPEVARTFRAMLRTVTEEERTETLVREYLGHGLAARLQEVIGGRDASARGAAAAACMAGLFLTRYVIRIDPIHSMGAEEVVRAMAPSLRAALSGGLGYGARP